MTGKKQQWLPKTIEQAQAIRRAEAGRNLVDVDKCFSHISDIEKELSQNWKTIDKEQTAALKLFADMQFRKLRMVIPELSSMAIETTSSANTQRKEITADDIAQLSRAQLLSLLIQAGALENAADGDYEEARADSVGAGRTAPARSAR